MANLILTGIIKKINPSEIKGSFEKRVFQLAEEKDKYPSVWQLEAHQAFCNELDKYSIGDKVECHVEVTGREWRDKAFNTLKCYRINRLSQPQQSQTYEPQANYQTAANSLVEDDGSELPF